MPIYSYKCRNTEMKPTGNVSTVGGVEFEEIKSCGHEYDVFYQNHAAVKREERAEACPKCGSKKKKRLVNTGTSFTLKGNWYRQGY